MKTKFSGILTLLLAFVVQLTFAQEKTISGTITDDAGIPLPGVSVVIKGTTKGTQSDFDGKYSITSQTGDVLMFRYLGMQSQDLTVGASTTMDVMMLTDIAALDEVLVVGYGTATKQSFAGTAKTVGSELLEIKNVSNVSQALAGEVAGVTVINTSGQPGTTSTIRIRGYGSVNGNRDPLYVVDGVPFGGSINSINPSDIKSTTVLKDATATAIYGARGSNGVILITTKGGAATEDYIEIDVKSGINAQIIPRYDVVTSPEEYIGYVWEGLYNRGAIDGVNPVDYANNTLFTDAYVNPGYNLWNVADASELIDPVTHTVRSGVTRRYTPELYKDYAFDSAFRNEGNLRMGGGDEKTKYYASFGYLNDDGYVIRTSYDRYTTRLNVNSNVKEWLNVGANIGYAYSASANNGQTNGSENLTEFSDKMAPIFPVFLRDANYNLVPDPIFGGYRYDYGAVSGKPRPNANNLNPIASTLFDDVASKRHELNGNFSMNIKFNDNLTLEGRYGLQYSNDRYKSYTNPFYGTAVGDGGNLFARDAERLSQNFLQLLRYKNQFGDHSLEVLAAHESTEYTYSEDSQYKGLVIVDGLLELDNFVNPLGPPSGYSEGFSIESYFGQVNYDFGDKYYLTGSVRRDGSSRFINEKWGTFYSVGGAWVMSNESFLKGSNLFTFLKLKASYGVTGDQAGVGYYSGYDTYNSSFLNGISISPRSNGNPDLTWEESKMFQTGVEFGLGNFIDGSVDYYVKKTDNLIFDRRVGPSQGIAIITVNDGQLQNQGIEFDLTGHLFNTPNFKLDLTVNGEIINNEITTMPLEPSTGLPRIVDTSVSPYGYSKGSSIYDFYTREWAGVDPADGAPMWYQYFNDLNGNGILDSGEDSILSMTNYLDENPDAIVAKQVTKTYASATNKYVGYSAIPDVRGAMRLAGQLGDFNFSTQFTYSIGGWALDNQYGELMSDRFGAAGNNFHKDIANRWMQPGDITNVPLLSDNKIVNGTSGSTRFLTKTDYLALNNVMIGYTLPSKFLANTGLSLVNIWASGDNLFVKTARAGFNPQTSETGSSGRALYAPLTTFTLGVRVKF